MDRGYCEAIKLPQAEQHSGECQTDILTSLGCRELIVTSGRRKNGNTAKDWTFVSFSSVEDCDENHTQLRRSASVHETQSGSTIRT